MPASSARPARASATARPISPAIDGLVYGDDPSEGFVRGRRFLHPKLGFTFVAPEGFVLDNTAQAVLGVKDGGGQALRLDVVRVPAEQTLADYLNSGWIENIDAKSVEETHHQRLPGGHRQRQGRPVGVPALRVRFGSDVYRFIFATKRMTAEIDRAFREAVGTFRRMTIAESEAAKPLHMRDRHGCARRHGRATGKPHGERRSSGRALPRTQRARPRRPGQARRPGEDRGGVSLARAALSTCGVLRPPSIPSRSSSSCAPQ